MTIICKKLQWLILLIFAMLNLIGVSNAEVKIYLDETRTEYIETEELDCRVYEQKNGLTIGFKLGTLFFSFGPEFSFGKVNKIDWDKTVQAIIARYKELCTRYNAGAITLKEYNERLKEIDTIAKEAMEFQEKMFEKLKKRSDDMLTELNAETGKKKSAEDEIGKRIQEIGLKVEQLP